MPLFEMIVLVMFSDTSFNRSLALADQTPWIPSIFLSAKSGYFNHIAPWKKKLFKCSLLV